MTQQDKLTELLKEFGIPFETKERESWYSVCVDVDDEKVKGYLGFHYKFIFDKDGNFKETIIAE